MTIDRPTFKDKVTLEDLFEGLELPDRHPELGPYRQAIEGEEVTNEYIQRGMIPIRLYRRPSTKPQNS